MKLIKIATALAFILPIIVIVMLGQRKTNGSLKEAKKQNLEGIQ